jgi:hypothetical protein
VQAGLFDETQHLPAQVEYGEAAGNAWL